MKKILLFSLSHLLLSELKRKQNGKETFPIFEVWVKPLPAAAVVALGAVCGFGVTVMVPDL